MDFQLQYGGTFFLVFVSQGLMQAFLACFMSINDLLLLLKNISLEQRQQQRWESLVIISCSTCCLVRPVKATWVCASFDSTAADDD